MTCLHPHTIAYLSPMLPPGGRRDETRLLDDLGLMPAGVETLAGAIETAWGITLSDRDVEAWQTLGDICQSIRNSLELEAA